MKIIAIACLLILAGCSQAPKKPALPPSPPVSKTTLAEHWQRHQQQVNAISGWQAQGRLAAAKGQQGGNASFVWDQKGDSYQIKLFGPFGAGAVYILGNPKFVEVKEANGKTTRAESPEIAMSRLLKMQVPVSGLRHWLRGIPVPTGDNTGQQLNDRGLLQTLNQQGWKIEYENYSDASPALPQKLLLRNGDIKIRMVITSWKNQ